MSSATPNPLRIGLVGCGGITHLHGPAALACPEVEIVACSDVHREAAEAWRERYGGERAYGDYETMLRDHELDAVLLATWPNLHHEQLLGCLEAGVRAILCEKSLVLTGAEALDVLAAATARDALVVEAFMYRHHPAFARVDELAAGGEVGAIDSIRAAFSIFDPAESPPDDPARDWRQRIECGGGVTWDLACYCVDACNRLARGLPRQVQAVARTSERYGTVDRLYGLIEYDSGVVAMVESSKRSDFDHELEVSGAEGQFVLPVAWRIEGTTALRVSRSGAWGEFDVTRIPFEAVDPYRLQFESFAAAARGVGRPTPALAESVVDALTIDALLASAAERRAVTIDVPADVASALAPVAGR
jgi:predicted dehydrogenase